MWKLELVRSFGSKLEFTRRFILDEFSCISLRNNFGFFLPISKNNKEVRDLALTWTSHYRFSAVRFDNDVLAQCIRVIGKNSLELDTEKLCCEKTRVLCTNFCLSFLLCKSCIILFEFLTERIKITYVNLNFTVKTRFCVERSLNIFFFKPGLKNSHAESNHSAPGQSLVANN